jgi:DNA-binding transcriptional MerR regulator
MMAARRYEIVVCATPREHLTLDALAARAGMHPALVERFVEFGLIEPIEWEGATLLFSPSAVSRLSRIVRLRDSLGINLTGIAVVLDLLERLEALKRENELLSGRL